MKIQQKFGKSTAEILVTQSDHKISNTISNALILLFASLVFVSLTTVYSTFYSHQFNPSSTINSLTKRSVDTLPEYTAFKENLKQGKSVCELPLAKGNCTRKFTRFYYNLTNEHCFKFVYTGCNGNGNRFLTKHQCKQRCSPNFSTKPSKLLATLAVEESPVSVVHLLNNPQLAAATGVETSICDQQECNAKNNAKCVKGKCRCFKGFEMRNKKCVDTNECHWVECGYDSICVNLLGSFRCECKEGYAGSGFNCTTNPAVCQQPFDQRYEKQCNSEAFSLQTNEKEVELRDYKESPTKESLLWQLRFYYDWNSQKCRQFWYGGCQFGNQQLNFFNNLKTCKKICGNFQIRSQLLETKPPLKSSESIAEVCLDAFDNSRRLPCSPSPIAQLVFSTRWTQRFYFDHLTKKCKLFWYDSICQHQPAVDPLATPDKRSKKSRNVFVHLNTCKQACEIPAVGEKKKTVGVIQAMFTQPKDRARNKSTDNEMEIKSSVEQKIIARPGLINAHIGAENAQKEHNRRFMSDDCLEKFDHSLKIPCSKGHFHWSPRYYYDANWKKCRMYWSDGACRSLTRNNFAELAICKWKCESTQSVESSVDGRLQERASCLDAFEHAYTDDCKEGQFSLRYYFDPFNKQCFSFQYGGCPAPLGKPASRNNFVNYEDCLQLCETPSKSMTKACSQPMDKVYRRPCDNHNVFSQYYYYDKKAEACRMFWYGNCKNSKSKNIFSTLKSCQWLCEKREEQKKPAHCLERFDDNYRRACNQGKQWRRKYYFDHKTGQCRPFWYDGCLSKSQNIFPFLSVCKSVCQTPALKNAPLTIQQLSSSSSEYIQPFGIQTNLRCLELMSRGDCQSELPAYFYNKYTKQCEPFSYSGCSGNGNRFLTLMQCEKTCQHYSLLSAQETSCLLLLNVGFGRENMSCVRNAGYRFYYNPQYGKCGRFWYFGCGGNENMFQNYAACERLCQGTILLLDNNSKADRRRIRKAQRNAVSVEACFVQPKINSNQTNQCSLEDELSTYTTNSSTISTTKWIYTILTKTCQPLEKTVCSSKSTDNSPSFDSQEQCISTMGTLCGGLKVPNSLECAYLPDWGPCNLLRYMWFYNLTKGSCEQFLWGGCDGNSNRFHTYELCQIHCEVPSDDLCSDKLDRGQWCESMTNRFYYHSASKSCKGFHYTGCGESRNNFKSLEDCEHRCTYKKQGMEGDLITTISNGTNQKDLKYSGSKPPEKPVMQRHHILLESSVLRRPPVNDSINSYLKAEGQHIDYGYCTGYRYNISGAFTRLTSYICLMEEGGTCQVHTLWDTGGDDQCKIVRPWLRGTHYYTWFFIVDRRPYWRRPDGPPIKSREKEEKEKSYLDHFYTPTTALPYQEKVTPPPIQDPSNTISSIIILPVNDCHSIC